MAPRKPTYDWKARACEEFRLFTVPFAIKEYVQNVVGQALKDLHQREFSEWKREDLRGISANEQDQRKKSLISQYPGLLTGPHGAVLKRTKDWLPFYILSATIPRSRLQAKAATDLKIALVVWRHEIAKMTALSVFNNHLDARATFSSFTVDGASTSRHNKWAVGEKGKGFILATQFLFEHVEKTISQMRDLRLPKDVKAAVSFRVGHQIGTLKWKKSRLYEDELLQVVLDDLTPHTVEQYIEKLATDARHKTMDFSDEDEDDSEPNDKRTPLVEPPKLRKQAESALKGVYTRRVTQQLDRKNEAGVLHNDGRCLVASDEVAITVIGLDGSFQPEYLFSAIYGIIPPAQAWRVPGSQVQFFVAAEDTVRNYKKSSAKFYHRDQYVPHGLHLHRLSINYHGNLNITSDRVAILRDDDVIDYKLAVSRSADEAFRTIPDLALELALDILSDEHSEGLAHLVRPHDKLGANAYREAFEAAIRKKYPEIAAEAHIHPTNDNTGFISPLFAELGMTPVKVSSKAWEIMEASGAYLSLDDYARRVLLSSPPIDHSHDLHRLRVAMSIVAKDVPSSNITIRNYDKSTPTVAWDQDSNTFAFALPPKCDDHTTSRCLCWVGPFLQDAAKHYTKDPEQARLSAKKLFSAYLACMNSKASMKDPNGMDVDPSQPASKTQGDSTSSKSLDSRAKTRSQLAPTSGRSPRQPNRPPWQAAPKAATTTATPCNPSVSQTPSESHPVESAKTQPAGVLAVDEDAPLAAFTNLVTALDEAHSMAAPLLDKFNSLMSAQEELSTQVDVLKIESATRQVRIEELNHTVAQKDALISSFFDKIRALEERNEQDAFEVEEFLRSRKRARN